MHLSPSRHRGLTAGVMSAGLLGLLAVGFWLRWRFVLTVSPDVDELTTIWAADRILKTGTPWMPSDVLYTRGILNSYTIAAFALVGGLTTTVARMPSVLFGLLSVVLIWAIGWREWNARVGLVAAAGLVFLPEALQADGHARFYAQHVFFTLLTIWVTYRAIRPVNDNRVAERAHWGRHWLIPLALGLALFAQEETVLLYPALVLGIFLWRGWSYFFQPPVFVTQLLCVGLIGLRYLMEQVGQPGYFAAIQDHKPYVGLYFDIAGAWNEYRSLYISDRRLLWTAMALLGLTVAIGALWRLPRTKRDHSRLLDLPAAHQATLFFALQFLFIFGVLLTLVSDQWRADRYILFVQPCWLLVGAAGAIWGVDRLSAQPWLRWLATGVLAWFMITPMWPSVQYALQNHTEGYDAAFAYVAANRQPGDIVMSPQPPACAAILGEPCDFYARERGFEPYVTVQNGVIVDRWSGATLLNTEDQLRTVLEVASAQGGRVWFVSDGYRLGKRYNEAFIRMTVEQFGLAFEERGVRVLQSAGWRAQPAYTVHKTFEPPIALGTMALESWDRTTAVPGNYIEMMLLWGRNGAIDEQINTSVQVAAIDGTRISQADGPPALGMISTFEETRGPLPDPKLLLLPTTLAPGRYRMEVIAYSVETQSLLTDPIAIDWFTIGPPPAAPAQPSDARWQNGLTLLGHDALPAALTPEASFVLRLVWQTSATVRADYTVFAHLLGPDGTIVAQNDRQPLAGFYPTSGWAPDEPVEDLYFMALPATLPAGEYRLTIGWYQSATGERLQLTDASDRVEIARWVVP